MKFINLFISLLIFCLVIFIFIFIAVPFCIIYVIVHATYCMFEYKTIDISKIGQELRKKEKVKELLRREND